MVFIEEQEIPRDQKRDVTYGRIVCNMREGEPKKNRTRLTVGGDRINHSDYFRTPTANLLTVKILVNSIISIKRAQFMTLEIYNIYLNTSITRYEYIRIKIEHLPEDMIKQYKLLEKAAADSFV